MKHVLVNQDGQVHAIILQCPFKYTLPRNMDAYHDITHDFSKPYNPTGKNKVDTFHHAAPKSDDDVQSHAQSFAIVRDGVIENCIEWGGAEWLPPYGTMLVPLEKWMGVNDSYNHSTNTFKIHENRLGKADKDKTVAELQQDAAV